MVKMGIEGRRVYRGVLPPSNSQTRWAVERSKGGLWVDIQGNKVLVLGGPGLVGMAVCRQLLPLKPREIQIHSLREEESLGARDELAPEAGDATLSVSWGDIFGMTGNHPRLAEIRAQGRSATDEELELGLNAVAAPIHGADGAVLATVCVSGPKFRLTPQRLPDVGRLAVDAAQQISRRLGFMATDDGTRSDPPVAQPAGSAAR